MHTAAYKNEPSVKIMNFFMLQMLCYAVVIGRGIGTILLSNWE